jgi:putative ABC transport system substrate-binding protein
MTGNALYGPGMDRRRFLLTSVAGVLGAPLAGEAQQAGKVWRIGYLGSAPSADDDAFRDGLREFGFVEGKNLVLEYRWANSDPNRFPTLAAELVTVGVDVILAAGNSAVLAAKTATITIPVVGLIMVEAVETGIIKSLARPGGNITGLTWEEGTDQATKRLELFKQLVPTISRMASVWNPTIPGYARYWPALRTAATNLGMAVYSVEYASAEDLDRALATILKDRPSAIFFWGSPVTGPRRQALCDFALKNRPPTLGGSGRWTEAGCLVSYSPSRPHQYRRAAFYVDKILKGVKPSDLPVEQPAKFELVINRKTAKALGLTIPPSLLLRADQVIE